jgi:hypothetical protein
MTARVLIAAGRGPARLPTCEHALRIRTKFYHFVEANHEGWFNTNRLRFDFRFDEWQDSYDAKTLAMRKMKIRTARVDDFSPLVVRALSLFGPGEMRALRVLDADVLRLVVLPMRAISAHRGVPAPQVGQALCAVHIRHYSPPTPDVLRSLSALLERHAATMTDLDADFYRNILPEVASALASCTRLESLTGAYAHDPAIWLRLSHLHTLRDVDLCHVSFAAIAAALPKLHTLKASGDCDVPAQTVNFCTDLLPRLREFHYYGTWPDMPEEQLASTTVAPLPLLQKLVWDVTDDENAAPREFLGAQPTVLHAPYALISQCWRGGAEEASTSFLTRVYDLRIILEVSVDPLELSDVVRVLRAAPQLKKFYTDHWVRGDASWLAPTAPTHPAFEGLVHPRLREFGISCYEEDGPPPDAAEWAAHLRRRHFPRLRELGVGDNAYFVTPPDVVSTTTAWITR